MTALRRRGQRHVGFGDGADRAVDDLEGDLVRIDFLQRLDDGLDRALGIGFDDDLEHLGGGGGELGEQIFKRHLGARLLLAQGLGFLRPLLG